MPARSVCVAAGTSPNVTYEREHAGTFGSTLKGSSSRPHEATVGRERRVTVGRPPSPPRASSRATERQARGHVLRRQPPALCRQRGQGDGEREGRLPVRGRAVPRGRVAEARGRSPRASAARRSPLREARRRASRARARGEPPHARPSSRSSCTRRWPRASSSRGSSTGFRTTSRTRPSVDGTRLAMEGLALTGAWIDPGEGLLGMIVLEMGGSRACAPRSSPASRSC